MKSRHCGFILVVSVGIVCLGGVAMAQDEEVPLSNWTAPPYWGPTVQRAEGEPAGAMVAHGLGMIAQAEALPSSPLPFVAITPCRIVDTRVAVSDGFHQPNFADKETRTFNLPASTDCTGLPSTAGAWSLNVQFRPISVASYITLFPTGTTMPTVSTLTASPAAWVEDAAIVPAGTAGAIDVYCQFAGRVVIDINGYYGPQSVVTSLNSKIGDITLAEGSNVTITPSAGTLTIAATGGPGGELPAGSVNQTLRSNGSAWVASSVLTNDGSNVGISGNLSLPNTTASTGQIDFGGSRFIHNYGPGGSYNIFLGYLAGNFSMTGGFNTASGYASLYSNTTGSRNTVSGVLSLSSNTTGSDNTAVGFTALYTNTTGSANTASSSQSLYSNTEGSDNTASGHQSLYSNTTGSGNTASGSQSLYFNTEGSDNTASGYQSLHANTTGSGNTASGYASLYANTSWYNTASGYLAGGANTTGSYNTFLGAWSDASANNLTNATAIGSGVIVNASNKVRIGNSAVTVIEGQVAFTWPSDARLKENIRELDLGLDLVMQLRPVSFTMKQGNGRTDMGFLAQDVEAVLGDGYNVLGIGGDPDRTLSLRGTDLIAPLVKAVQEQQAQIDSQKATIKAQQAEIDTLKSGLSARRGQDRLVEDLAHRLALLEAQSKAGAEPLR